MANEIKPRTVVKPTVEEKPAEAAVETTTATTEETAPAVTDTSEAAVEGAAATATDDLEAGTPVVTADPDDTVDDIKETLDLAAPEAEAAKVLVIVPKAYQHRNDRTGDVVQYAAGTYFMPVEDATSWWAGVNGVTLAPTEE